MAIDFHRVTWNFHRLSNIYPFHLGYFHFKEKESENEATINLIIEFQYETRPVKV